MGGVPPGPGTSVVRCDFCGRSFDSVGALQRHVASDHAGRPFAPTCDVCGQRFESPADLQVHHRVAHRSGG